jgi:uncharacterized protein YdeI (YjbR/CyaY-like superfamily)
MKIEFFETQADLRKWFDTNHELLTEVWIGYYKKATEKESINWEESVEEALCFGWIDGIRKSIDEESYKIRFTPRKQNSNWSLKNIKTIETLINNGLVKQVGLDTYTRRKADRTGVYSFEQEHIAFKKKYESILMANQQAYDFFKSRPPSYQRMATHWVMSAKLETTRLKRLNQLIKDSINQLKIKPLRRTNE